MTNKTADLASDLKVRHRAMWASGDYPAVATQVIAGLGPTLVEAVGVRAYEVVLDIAAGSGNASIPAAKKGAEVVASDLTPELFDVGRQLAAEERVELSWREADAESLPFADSSFDVVMSCVGVMFAPHHQESADELIRVCRPGGRIGLINWTPTGFIGRMFATMKPYAPALRPERSRHRYGATRSIWAPCSPTGSVSCPPRARPRGRPLRVRRGIQRLLQGHLRADYRRVPKHQR